MATIQVTGVLEIDPERGVIYFHASEGEVANRFGGQTLLRICRLPVPIPERQLDITHMVGVNWGDYGPANLDKHRFAPGLMNCALIYCRKSKGDPIHFTDVEARASRSGRMSISEPNLSNIPKEK